jgi:hypothetical protein
MNRIRRRIRATVNPVSTAAARWWCHSAVRHVLTAHGPAARQRLIHDGIQGSGFTPSAGRMKARAAAVDELVRRDNHQR